MVPQGCALVPFVIHTGQDALVCHLPPYGKEVGYLASFHESFGREGDEEVDIATATRMRAHFHANRSKARKLNWLRHLAL